MAAAADAPDWLSVTVPPAGADVSAGSAVAPASARVAGVLMLEVKLLKDDTVVMVTLSVIVQ